MMQEREENSFERDTEEAKGGKEGHFSRLSGGRTFQVEGDHMQK